MPGPAPPYRPCFPLALLEQARQMVRHRTMKFPLRQRAGLVFLRHAQPLLSHVDAGRWAHLPPEAVRHWRRRWSHGDCSLADEPGRGRHARFFPPLDHAVVKALACAVVSHTHQPLSRQSLVDLPGRAHQA